MGGEDSKFGVVGAFGAGIQIGDDAVPLAVSIAAANVAKGVANSQPNQTPHGSVAAE